ncbi:unnamed protein product [Symbiodinium pilosum]|uniref:PX domain-containing protein n=1 Tax=Symbiodinium pilosum TaxID=2952 RepID=A0A812XK13_SYMPI|nr:unnamed protein product [Symbiodinium pilosum]
MENTHFSAFCTGFDDLEGHVRYIFQVVHIPSGCAWKVHRRYREMLALHEQLAGTATDLPEFPPKALNAWSWILGEDVPVQRVSSFQTYFAQLLARDDLTRRPATQALLGVQRPDPVAVVVSRWRMEPDAFRADVELSVTCDAFSPRETGSSPFSGTIDSPKPVEEFLVFIQGSPSTDPVASARPGEPLWATGLPTGEEMTLEVRAANGIGMSEPTTLSILSPGERALPLSPGVRVRAVWAGDGAVYDAVVKSVPVNNSGYVLLDWLRPAPLSDEKLSCVCEVGDDTAHRMVPRGQVFRQMSDAFVNGSSFPT